jgi:hypothetical protein
MNVVLQQAETTIVRWQRDPVAFVREVFSVEPDPWQAEMLRDIIVHNRISVRSGHGVGKTTALAWAIIWWMATHYPVKVACTAPSANQLYDILWSEIRMWLRRAMPVIQSQFVVKSDRIDLVGGGDSFASARTARSDSPDALQGFHSENMLFIIDEAPGVPDVIFEVARGAMSTPGAKQILTGNPTRRTGYFANSQKPTSGFHKIHVSSVDSSRVSREWVEEMKEEYGEDNPVYKVRVLGEFADSDVNTFMAYDLVKSAVGRPVVMSLLQKPVWGLDVARFGADRSCLVVRYPYGVPEMPVVWSGLDTMELTGQVVAKFNATPERERPSAVYVDVIGIGSGVVDRLRELGLPVVPVNVSEVPSFESSGAHKMRDELWLTALKWFETRQVAIPDHLGLITELTSVCYGFASTGKIKMEAKDDYKKRGNRSPDVADAFVLTFAYQSAVGQGFFGTPASWSKPIIRNLQLVA